jgi:Fe-S cluster assembly protein SufD
LDKDLTLDIDAILIKKVDFRPIDKFEPEWFYNLRKAGWDYYHDSPLPNRAINVWRYTDPKLFIIQDPEQMLDWLPVLPDNSPQEIKPIKPEHAAFGYNRSDLRTFAQMTPELGGSGVIFKDLFSALRENEELVRPYLGKLVGAEFGKLEAFNMAMWNNGLFLYIPQNAVIEKPIYMHRHPTGQYTIQRLLVVVGESAQATVIDDYSCHCQGMGMITNAAVELFVGDSANVRYINIQRLGVDARPYITERGLIGKGSSLFSIFGGVGAAVTKVNAGTILAGRGANSQMSGVVFGSQMQHFDYHTVQNHRAAESFSNLDFRVVLKDKSMSAYTGLIRVEKDTVNCEAYQENRNLLLNRGTKAESIPELEILTDQVRCTHGATMGPIDPEQVFYLRSRGYSEAEAVKAVVRGFMEPTLVKMPEDAAAIIRELVRVKMDGENNGGRVH